MSNRSKTKLYCRSSTARWYGSNTTSLAKLLQAKEYKELPLTFAACCVTRRFTAGARAHPFRGSFGRLAFNPFNLVTAEAVRVVLHLLDRRSKAAGSNVRADHRGKR